MNKVYILKRLEEIISNLQPLQNAMEDDGLQSYAGEIEDSIVTLNALIFGINHAK